MTMGETIRQFRNAKGFSQEVLAEKLNVSRSAVAKWEADGGVPEIDNLLQLSIVFNVSVDELIGNTVRPNINGNAKSPDRKEHNFGNQPYDIELTGWNDGVYGAYIIAEDQDFLYYYQSSKKTSGIYGMIGRKHITSVLPVNGNELKQPIPEEVSREFFRGIPVQISLAKREGLIRGLLDFRDDAYRNVLIESFEKDVLHLRFGGTIPLADIAKIEKLNDP